MYKDCVADRSLPCSPVEEGDKIGEEKIQNWVNAGSKISYNTLQCMDVAVAWMLS